MSYGRLSIQCKALLPFLLNLFIDAKVLGILYNELFTNTGIFNLYRPKDHNIKKT